MKKAQTSGRPSADNNGEYCERAVVTINESARATLESLGNGNLSAGIRKAASVLKNRLAHGEEAVNVHCLVDSRMFGFSAGTLPDYAVVYAYVTEDRPELASAFFNAVRDDELEKFKARHNIKVLRGRVSVSCGDWACLV